MVINQSENITKKAKKNAILLIVGTLSFSCEIFKFGRHRDFSVRSSPSAAQERFFEFRFLEICLELLNGEIKRNACSRMVQNCGTRACIDTELGLHFSNGRALVKKWLSKQRTFWFWYGKEMSMFREVGTHECGQDKCN